MAKILIADDAPTSQKLITMIIENMGHVVLISPDGRHAYETLKAEKDIKLLITDMKMPIMDGRQLIQAIREDPELKTLPIIAMSAFVNPKAIREILSYGASLFQPKPLRRGDLEDSIKQCL